MQVLIETPTGLKLCMDMFIATRQELGYTKLTSEVIRGHFHFKAAAVAKRSQLETYEIQNCSLTTKVEDRGSGQI